MPRNSLTSLLVAAALLIAPALALLALPPIVSAEAAVLDTFVGGVPSAELTFAVHPWNASLALELPRGSQLSTASFSVGGIEGPGIIDSVVDFSGGAVGADRWAMWKADIGLYPPDLDPYKDVWKGVSALDLASIGRDEGRYWHTQTPNQLMKPPWEWPLQVYQFDPDVPSAPAYTVAWNGYGTCAVNQTSVYQAEMWLFNHTSSEWESAATHASNAAGDVWLNVTIESGSVYRATNGSIPVAMVGPHSDTDNQPRPRIDFGHLYTDYIAVVVSGTGADEYPSHVNVTVNDVPLALSAGELSGTVVVGDAHGLRATIQAIIDDEPVMPGNITVTLNFTVARTTMARLSVGALRIDHDVPVNAPPTWVGPASVEVAEDAQWTDVLTMESTFTDDYNPDDLRFSILNVTDAANLSVNLNAMPNGTHVLAVKPAPNYYGAVALELGAKDLFDATGGSGPLTVLVRQVGDAPRFVDPPELRATEEEAFAYDLECTDLDLPDDTLTFSDTDALLDVDPATGRIEWTPTGDQVGTHSFTVTVTDRFGLQDTTAVHIVVDNVNDAPVITSVGELAAVQDVKATYTITVEDPDLQYGDSIHYFAYADTVELAINAASGVVTFTPRNEDWPGFDITVIVQDSATAKDELVVHVTVSNVNDPPALADIGRQEADEGDAVSVRVVATDPDSLLALPVPEQLTISGEWPEWFVPDEEGWVNLTVDQSMVGEHALEVTVTDREGLSDSITVVMVLNNVNDVPVITTPVNATVTAPEDERFTLALGATDHDGDALTWSEDTMLFAINPSTGLINFTPRQSQLGTYTVTVSVTDGLGGKSTVTFKLIVQGVNDAPVIKSAVPVNGTLFESGAQVMLQAVATDEDGDALTFTWMEGTKELGSGTPFQASRLRSGHHTVTLVVSDGTATVEQELRFEVEAGPDEGLSAAALAAIAAIVIVAVVVAAVLVARSRRGATPPPPPEAAQSPPGTGGTGADGTPRIEIEHRET